MSKNLKARSVGLAGGSLWLIVAGGGSLAWALFAIGSPLRGAAFAWVFCLAALLATGILVIRRALQLPTDGTDSSSDRDRIRKRFRQVVVAELLGFAVVNPILAATHHFLWMTAANLVIIGLHFLPLAEVFKVPRYYLMGMLFCAIPAATILFVSQSSQIGEALAWNVLPVLGCGCVAVLVGAAGLRESWRTTAAEQSLTH